MFNINLINYKNPLFRVVSFALAFLLFLGTLVSMVDIRVSASEISESYNVNTKEYILENIDPRYAKGDKLIPTDAIVVKQTFALRSLMPENDLSLEGLWSSVNEEGLIGEAFLTQNQNAVYMYNTDDDSDYYVAYINPLIRDKSIETVQVDFAKYNLDGEEYDDCIYDGSTGLAYIPKKYTSYLFQSQCQLLQIVDSLWTKSSVYTDINSNIDKSVIESNESVESKIYETATTIELCDEKEILEKIEKSEIAVYVNGDDIPWDNFEYDSESGTIVIPVAPSNIDSVRVEVKNKGVIKSVFSKIKNLVSNTVLGTTAYAATSKYFGRDGISSPVSVAPLIIEYDGNAKSLRQTMKVLRSTGSTSRNYVNYMGYPYISSNNSSAMEQHPENVAQGNYGYTPMGDDPSFYPSIDDVMSGGGREIDKNHRLLADYIINGGSYAPTIDGDKKTANTNPLPYSKPMGPHFYRLVLSDGYTADWNGCNIRILKDRTDPDWNLFSAYTADNKQDASKIEIPMHCAHIATSLGEYNEAADDYSVAMRIIDTQIDEHTGEGEALIGLVSQHSPIFTTDGVRYRQAGLGMIVVKLKKSTPQYTPSGTYRKVDSETSLNAPQGNASLAGARFKMDVFVNEQQDDGSFVERLDSTYNATSSEDGSIDFAESIPAGARVVVEELSPPPGYSLPTLSSQRRYQFTAGAGSGSFTFRDPVKRGGISIEKWDSEYDRAYVKQGDASLQGAEFTIYNNSINSVYVNGSLKQPGEEVLKIVTDEKGYAATSNNALPWGSYTIKETKAPEGYLLNPYLKTFTIGSTEVGKINPIGHASDDVIRGGVRIVKRDLETKKSVSLAGGDELSGITFGIWNISNKNLGYGNNIFYEFNSGNEAQKRAGGTSNTTWGQLVGDKSNGFVGEIVTYWDEKNKEYAAQTSSGALPYGTYLIAEIGVPKNGAYILSDRSVWTFEIRQDGMIVSDYTNLNGGITDSVPTDFSGNIISETINGSSFSFTRSSKIVAYDRVRRNDIEFEKVSDSDMKRLQVAFLLTNKDTGEAHVLVTNENGEAATHVDVKDYLDSLDKQDAKFPRHTWDTNANDALYFAKDEDGNIDYGTIIYSADNPLMHKDFDTKAGIWFGDSIVNDNLSALPFGHYNLRELRSDTNMGYELLEEIDFVVNSTKYDATALGIDISTVTNDYIEMPSIITNAEDLNTKSHEGAFVNSKGKLIKNPAIVDTVSYENLKSGEDYELIGTIYDKDLEEPLKNEDEEIISVRESFNARGKSGEVKVKFNLSPEDIAGKNLVVFERLMKDGQVIAVHEDINDEYQSVSYPALPLGPSIKKEILTYDSKLVSDKTLRSEEEYGYRMSVTNGEYALKDVTLVDMIEKESGSAIGLFNGLDLSQAQKKGLKPKVFYTTAQNPTENDWNEKEPKDLKDVTGIKIVLEGLLGAGDEVFMDIKMTAPSNTTSTIASNKFNMSYEKLYDDDSSISQEPTDSNTVRVEIDIEPSIVKSVVTYGMLRSEILGEYASLESMENYAHRMLVTAGNHDIKDPVFTDIIEREGQESLGKFVSISIDDAKNKGFNPVVYYTMSENPNESDWSTSLPENVEDVVGVRVKLMGVLKASESVYIDANMKAPVPIEEITSYNKYYLNWTKIIPKGVSRVQSDVPSFGETSGIEEDIIEAYEEAPGQEMASNVTKIDIYPQDDGEDTDIETDITTGFSPKTGDSYIPIIALIASMIVMFIALAIRIGLEDDPKKKN